MARVNNRIVHQTLLRNIYGNAAAFIGYGSVKINFKFQNMGSEVDVFITNYALVDPDIYQLWIEGYTANEAVSHLNQAGLGQITGASLELIASDVLDHYRTYSLLEKLLSNPKELQEQLSFQLDLKTKRLLIEKYYGFDDSVIRELLGKKLSSKYRKDLDEVSDKTNMPLKSCRRQFDNVKRIYKTVEEMPGSLLQNIQKHFHLSEELAKKYASIVFLGCMRFETSKRKLQHLTFSALRRCAELVMESWTYPSNSPEYYDTEMDKEFLLDLRELRVLTDKEKEHKQLVCSQLKPLILQKTYTELESNFRSYSRSIITLAVSLHRSREIRNLFVDLCQILDIWKQGGWAYKDLQHFMVVFADTAFLLDLFKEGTEAGDTWRRYMLVVGKCLAVMYLNQ